VTLTQDGQNLLPAANRALTLLSQITEGKWHKSQRHVTVAHIPVVLLSIVPQYIRLWKSVEPGLRIQLTEGFPSEIIRTLHSGNAELGFILEPPNDASLLSHKIASFPYEVALPKHETISKNRKNVSLRAMEGLKWVTIPDKFRPRPRCPLLMQMESLGFHRETRTIVGSLQALLSMVAAGEGFALLPVELKKLTPSGIVFRKCVERLPSFDIYLIWRKDETDVTILKMASATR
jgi:LysR family transcriptional regulator, benzoate and cis,cis-muconate-responsive activator of ben and cat genes